MLQNPATKNVKSIFICHPCKMESHKKKKKKDNLYPGEKSINENKCINTQILKFLGKNIKAAIIIIFPLFKEVEENLRAC